MLSHFPPQTTPFVGRTQELADISARLATANCRLLTITGAGGSGKTRLAVEIARLEALRFSHGAVFVGLQPLSKSDLLVTTIAHTLGLSFYGSDDPKTQLFRHLHEKSLFLLLDNFEHLLDGAALVSELLAHSVGIRVVVTSREALNLQEEWLYPLKGMITPPSIYSTALEDYEAVQLFLYHAQRMQPNFDLADQHQAVIRICKMAEGLPLAIELAASWLKGLSAAQIATEMQHNLDFLATTARNVEERHRSIRTVFEQSWKLLSEAERQTFARLSVFRGGFDREAAHATANASLLLLAGLVEKSLLQRQPSGRYEIHELLRQFAEEKLAVLDDTRQAHYLHTRYYNVFTQEREIDLKGRRQIDGLDAVELNFENIHVAWDWAVQARDYSTLHTMVEGLLWFGILRSRQHNVNALYEHALQQASGDGSDYLKARIVARQCQLLPFEAAPPILAGRLENSLNVVKQLGSESEAAICEVLLGLFLAGVEQSHFERALELTQEALLYFQRTDDRFYVAQALQAVSMAYYYQGDRQRAMHIARECAQIRREIGDRYGTARIVLLIAAEAYSIPDYEKAELFNREVRDIWFMLKSWSVVAFVNVNLAYLAIFRGDFEAARNLSDEALTIAKEVNIGDHIAYALAMSGVLASLDERYADAWQILMEAQTLAIHTSSVEALEWGLPLAACGLHDYETARIANLRALQYAHRLNAPGRYFWHLPATCILLAHEGNTERAAEILGFVFTHPASAPAWMEQWGLLTRLRSDLETALGTAEYQAAWKRGETLDLKDVVDHMLEWLAGSQVEPATPKNPALEEPLTPREIEVLHLLAAGLTNPQIAEQLVIGTGTVKTHTLNIYRKLDVANRTQAILRAQTLGILV
ncbi:MAG: tetratricopeptide repeat protein [Burkholderiales bacterium]|nr:tetratricopeptide repeat protein [Anaerolineae bacterium]